MEIALRGDISFPLLGGRCYSTLWGGIGYFIWVWKKLVVLPDGSTTVSFFLCRKEISDEISLLGLSR